jgi:hypothetical protein
MRGQLSEKIIPVVLLLLAFKRQNFVYKYFCGKTVLSIVWIRNRNVSKVGTGTAISHYGSTTLTMSFPFPWLTVKFMGGGGGGEGDGFELVGRNGKPRNFVFSVY